MNTREKARSPINATHSHKSYARRLIATAVIAIIVGFYFLAERWLFDTWAALSIDELLFHMQASLQGTDLTVAVRFVTLYLPWFIVIVIGIVVCVRICKRQGAAACRIAGRIILVASIIVFCFTTADAANKLNLIYYLQGSFSNDAEQDFIGKSYINPDEVQITFPEKRRNVIYLFLESVEDTYADEASGGAFEQNAIPELTKLAQDNEDFSGSDEILDGGLVFAGCDWTMGGMFAQTSGTPLKIPTGSDSLAAKDELFVGMTTLGDILEREGYNQELLIGSEAIFGGRKAYFSSHGNYDIYDLSWAHENGFVPPDYHEFWGFEDEKLFSLAKTRLGELSSSDGPFNLTLLTVDTHFEDGYVCRLCENEFGDNQYANVMACSSRQVTEFVKWVQAQDFYENTTIIVSGDHTTMDRDFCDNVPATYQRKTFVAVINPAIEPIDPNRHREYATFDLFPTTLAAMGATIEGDRLGIGTNLFSDEDTLVEIYGSNELMQKLAKRSAFLEEFLQITVDDAYMQKTAEKVFLRAHEEENGTLTFSMAGSNYLRDDMIKSMKLSVHDARDNSNTAYDVDVKRASSDDPNKLNCSTRTSYVKSDLEYLSGELLVSIEDYTDYQIATFDKTIEVS